ncbi:MAG: hypothetical protein J0H99_01940, partial [Rhodospirillales bacterium]|nr:hypothetical protein [Rhodospirillales bacterium]
VMVALTVFWIWPSLLVLSLLLAPPAVVFFGWGPNRRWLLDRKESEIRGAIRFGSSVGKWIVGVSGVGFALCFTLVISGYTGLEGAGDHYCEASYIAADAMSAGLEFLRPFALMAMLGFAVMFMPELSRLYCWLMSDLNQSDATKIKAQRVLFGVQMFLMIFALWGIALMLFYLSYSYELTQKGVYRDMKRISDHCAERI